MKRIRAAPMGRAYRYYHRLAHIVVIVDDGQSEEAKAEE
jgi:ribosomal protein L22